MNKEYSIVFENGAAFSWGMGMLRFGQITLANIEKAADYEFGEGSPLSHDEMVKVTAILDVLNCAYKVVDYP